MTPTRRLLHYFALYKKRLMVGAACVFGSALFSLAKPLIIGNAVNALGSGFTREMLIRYALLLIGASVVEGMFLYLQRSIIIGASATNRDTSVRVVCSPWLSTGL